MRNIAQGRPRLRGETQILWTLFGDWLAAGAPGVLPETLRQMLGPVWRRLPLARQMLWALGPWMLVMLRARERGPAVNASVAARWGEEALRLRPFVTGEMSLEVAWLIEMLVWELGRLVWLAEGAPLPEEWDGWLEWLMRYWALAIALMRIGQLYDALSQEQDKAWAGRVLARAMRQVWSQAVGTARAA